MFLFLVFWFRDFSVYYTMVRVHFPNQNPFYRKGVIILSISFPIHIVVHFRNSLNPVVELPQE